MCGGLAVRLLGYHRVCRCIMVGLCGCSLETHHHCSIFIFWYANLQQEKPKSHVQVWTHPGEISNAGGTTHNFSPTSEWQPKTLLSVRMDWLRFTEVIQTHSQLEALFVTHGDMAVLPEQTCLTMISSEAWTRVIIHVMHHFPFSEPYGASRCTCSHFNTLCVKSTTSPIPQPGGLNTNWDKHTLADVLPKVRV